MPIEGLRKCRQHRGPKGRYFLHLPPDRRRRAQQELDKSLARARAKSKTITPQRLGGMVASAIRLSGMSAEQRKAHCRMMQATQGGLALQAMNRANGINPTYKATYKRLMKQGHADSARRFLERQRGGSPPGLPQSVEDGYRNTLASPGDWHAGHRAIMDGAPVWSPSWQVRNVNSGHDGFVESREDRTDED